MKKVAIILIILVAIIFGFYYFSDVNSTEERESNDLYKTSYGFSFKIPEGCEILDQNKLICSYESNSNEEIIEYSIIENDVYETVDLKLGKYSITFNEEKSCWWVDQPGERDPIRPPSCEEPIMFIEGLPVFETVGRWKTYLIADAKDRFVRINISGSGETRQLEDLISSIRFD